MINCIVVDDEDHAIEILLHYIRQIPELNLLSSFINPLEALQFVNGTKVDLIFLDIQMPELSGIDFIKTIKGKSKVVLTTAYSEFALEGYDLYVVDYLLKPIRLPRFLQAVNKASEQLQLKRENEAKTDNQDDFVFVKTESKGKLLKIELADIDFIESRKNYMVIHRSGTKTLVYTSMKELEDRLPKSQFIRVHKSFIVAIARIVGIEGNMVRLKQVQQEIVIGETYKAPLMELIKGKMIE